MLEHPKKTIEEQINDAEEIVSKIKTEIDPEFIYQFEKTKFVPPPGKTLLIVRQNIEAIKEYN